MVFETVRPRLDEFVIAIWEKVVYGWIYYNVITQEKLRCRCFKKNVGCTLVQGTSVGIHKINSYGRRILVT
jgi:hypothetical protein